jgi:hypothetical protein
MRRNRLPVDSSAAAGRAGFALLQFGHAFSNVPSTTSSVDETGLSLQMWLPRAVA